MRFTDEREKNTKTGRGDWFKAISVVIAGLVLYRAVQSTGWLGGLGVTGDKLTFGVSFLVGIAASFSSCLAVVGGIVIAFSEKYNSREAGLWKGAMLPNVKFHIGRMSAFFVLGGLLGLIGGTISLGGNFVSIYTIIVGIIMGWLGLSILNIVPSISSLGLRTPKFLVKYWGRLEDSEHQSAPFLLGGLTFFLPCGFTQSMQIFALASGSFFSGATIMLAFSLGTMPVLLALGGLASWAKLEKMAFINKAAGILIILFAAYTLNAGYSLMGKKSNITSVNSSQQKQEVQKKSDAALIDNGFQEVEMKITSRGFQPDVIRIKNNVPVRFVVNGDQATGCTNKIVIPDLNVAKDIKKGDNIIEFTPQKLGPVSFSCWMGMVRGKFVVE